MKLHCREFDVDGNSVILGHDRETGKRYLVKHIHDSTCIQREFPELAKKSDFLQVFCSIFWIDEKKEGENMKGIKAVFVPCFSAPVTCRVLERIKKYPLDEYKILITAKWTKEFYKKNGYHPAYAYGQIYTVLYYNLFDTCRFKRSSGCSYATGKEWYKFFDEKNTKFT